MWLLGRVVPIMLGYLVPEEDEFWQNMIILLDILQQILSPVITADECSYLQILIQEHHENFVHLYPDSSVIPKMHYMVHMPRILIK